MGATKSIVESGFIKRILSPRLLYSLERERTVELLKVSSVLYLVCSSADSEKENIPCPDYVFVAYTKAHFPTQKDRDTLHQIGLRAAINAGCSYYWCGAKCVHSKNLNAQDVSLLFYLSLY